jgi:hypothetical protein
MVLIDSDHQPPAFNAILVERADPKTILMTGARGNSLRVAFSTTRVAAVEGEAVAQFAHACAGACEVEGFEGYFVSVLNRALGESHGTITSVPGMTDAIKLLPPVDLPTAFGVYRTADSAESILELQRSENLLTALLQSDGIVVFDAKGRAAAYRVFYKPPSASSAEGEAIAPAAPPVVGGARRRAFEGVRSYVGNHLKAALFRSQDGHTEYQGD